MIKCKHCKREIDDDSVFCKYCGGKVVATRQKQRVISVPEPHQLSDGTWTAQLMVKGKRFYVPPQETKALYYSKARQLRAEQREPDNAAAMSLGKAISDYIESNTAVLSPATVRGYKTYQKRLAKWADKKISAINMQSLVSAISKKHSPKYVRNIWGLIGAALKAKGISVPDVNLPQKIKAERPWLDYEQIQTFLQAIHGDSCELASLLALHSLRRSELLALKPESISDDVIRVSGAVVFNPSNRLVFKETNKTTLSARDVPVMIPRLLELAHQLPITQHPSSVYRRINKVCSKADLPEVGFQGLRHSFASLAYHLKWDIKTVQRVGGWSSPAVPQEIYSHLAAQDANADVEAMVAFYSQITCENSKA